MARTKSERPVYWFRTTATILGTCDDWEYVLSEGHSYPAIKRAAQEQADRDYEVVRIYVSWSFRQHELFDVVSPSAKAVRP